MHKYYKLFFSVLIFLAACKSEKTPRDIIDQPRMTSLLTEVHIADGSLYNLRQEPDTLYKYATAKYLILFREYHTDSVQFKKSYIYYTRHPEILATMYEQIANNLKQKSDSLNKINQDQAQKDSKRRADSISKLPKQPPAPAVTPRVKPNVPTSGVK